MWESLQNIVPGVASRYGVRRTFNAIEVCNEFRQIAKQLFVEAEFANQIKVRSYNVMNHTLTIEAASSIWAGIIQMNTHKIENLINQKFGPGTIKRVRIVPNESIQ